VRFAVLQRWVAGEDPVPFSVNPRHVVTVARYDGSGDVETCAVMMIERRHSRICVGTREEITHHLEYPEAPR
jgi:hypothetical protein